MEKTQGYTRYLQSTTSEKTSHSGDSELRDQAPKSQMPSFDNENASHVPQKDLSFLSDVSLSISAELGRCTITIRKLLTLTPGSVLTLSDVPQAQVSLRANGHEVAKGEVVSVNDHFGVRITEVA